MEHEPGVDRFQERRIDRLLCFPVNQGQSGDLGEVAEAGEVVFPVVMPWLPMRMMLVDPFRVMVEPPVAVAPIMMVVPVAIFQPPLVMGFGPFGMMLPEPSRMVIVPPVGVVPPVMFVEVASFTMFVGARSMR